MLKNNAGDTRPPEWSKNLFMLILSRKIEQSIIINGDIVVKILRVDRDSVKLGIDAPQDVVVNREEIQLTTQGRPKRRALQMVNAGPIPAREQADAAA
jgi:carbon storage regulator